MLGVVLGGGFPGSNARSVEGGGRSLETLRPSSFFLSFFLFISLFLSFILVGDFGCV